jgi:hypothetical protein
LGQVFGISIHWIRASGCYPLAGTFEQSFQQWLVASDSFVLKYFFEEVYIKHIDVFRWLSVAKLFLNLHAVQTTQADGHPLEQVSEKCTSSDRRIRLLSIG